jgi:hypothetical protein
MKFAGKIATVLLLLVYMTAFVGFRLHECALDHTVEVLPLLAGESCEEVHHHDCGDEARCGHHHHHCAEDHHQESTAADPQFSEADCCSNSLHCLSDAQLLRGVSDVSVAVKCLPAAPVAAIVCEAPSAPVVFAGASAPAMRSLKGRTMLALYSVRRV